MTVFDPKNLPRHIQPTLLTVTREAMKGEFEVAFPRERFPNGTEAALDALDEVERLEQLLSVFRFDSRVRYINLVAHEMPVRLDDELFGLISVCQNWAEKTDGAVDITSGPLWKAWGFAKRDGRIPTQAEIDRARELVDYRLIELDPESKTIRFKKPGVELNFGCVGKGFALDVAARKLLAKGVDEFLFHGGLSSILSRGTKWTIGVAHPLRPGKRLAEIDLMNQAVGTSGAQHQFFRHRGRRYSHLIDPRTGWPVQGVHSVTVVAESGALAELFSTAFFVMGLEKGEPFWKDHAPGAAVFFVSELETGKGFAVKSIGFPENRFRMVDEF